MPYLVNAKSAIPSRTAIKCPRYIQKATAAKNGPIRQSIRSTLAADTSCWPSISAATAIAAGSDKASATPTKSASAEVGGLYSSR